MRAAAKTLGGAGPGAVESRITARDCDDLTWSAWVDPALRSRQMDVTVQEGKTHGRHSTAVAWMAVTGIGSNPTRCRAVAGHRATSPSKATA